METLKARNPVGERAIKVDTPLAPRMKSLEGQTLGLWWNFKDGGNIALERIGAELVRRFGVKLHKSYSPLPAPRSLIESAAREATMVIGASAD
jgi:hypothetical protein